MSISRPPPDRVEQRIKTEARAAVTCLMPRTDDDLRKSTTRLMVIGWLLWTFGIGLDRLSQGDVVLAGFTIYQLTSFVVLYTFGRMHNLEVEQLLPWLDSNNGSSNRQYIPRNTDREQDHDEQDGGTGGFVYRTDSSDDDQ